MRIIVVGAGIAGLGAAWSARQAAQRAGRDVDIVVLEGADEVGGKAHTVKRDGWLAEEGPSGTLGPRPELDLLIKAAGLENDVVFANPVAAKRFIYSRGKLRKISGNPIRFAGSGILSVGGMARLFAEPLVPAKRDGPDESAWQFAARRIGSEAADRLIVPMVLGVFAGDAREISLASAFPKMAALERNYGSLVRGMIAKQFAKRNAPPGAPKNSGRGTLMSFRDGMQTLPSALAAKGAFTVRCRARVQGIVRNGDAWRVGVRGGESIDADAVVLSGEPWQTAPLVAALDGDAATALRGIAGPPVSVVNLGFAEQDAAGVPIGFGVLIGRGEGVRALGHLWESRFYPGRSPAGHVLIRAMFGGAMDRPIGDLDESELVALARAETQRLYGVTAAPVFVHVTRLAAAIPQYTMGHAERVARVERAAEAMPGLFVTGSGLHGVSFADAAAHGVACGERVATSLLGGAH